MRCRERTSWKQSALFKALAAPDGREPSVVSPQAFMRFLYERSPSPLENISPEWQLQPLERDAKDSALPRCTSSLAIAGWHLSESDQTACR
jgi:hypothetical protein